MWPNRPRSALFAPLLLLGCRSQLLEPDGGAAAATVDLATVVNNACTTYKLVSVPLSGAAVYAPGGAQPFAGRAVRVVVTYRRLSGDLPGPLDAMEIGGDGSDILTLTAHVWRPSPTFTTAETEERRLVTFADDGEILYRVVDSLGGNDVLDFKLPGPADFTGCAAGPRPLGSKCTHDCECMGAGVRCVPIDPSVGLCEAPCNEDVECDSPTVRCSSEAAGRTCVAAGEDCFCPPDDVCGPGQSCLACACAVSINGGSVGRACGCGSDCPTAYLCTGGRCELRCATPRDCPAGYDICGGGLCSSTR
jgi:hypothetical protein